MIMNQQGHSDLGFTENQNQLREVFAQKLLNLQVLRQAKSMHDLVRKQHRLEIAKKMNQKGLESQESIQFHKEIQKIKQKLIKKLKIEQKVDQQKIKQLKSREISHNKIQNKTSANPTSITGQKTAQNQLSGSPSYNYFNYGQRVPLIEGRQIQFKHFKDISDPHHIPLIMRYITAFLNSEGGKLLIGIDDSSYVYGAKFSQYQYDKFLLNIDKEGKFGMSPSLMPQKYEIRRIPVNHQKRGQQRWVIEIKVHPDTIKPKKITTYNRRCYMRMNASNHELDATDLMEYLRLNNEDQKCQNQKSSEKQFEQNLSKLPLQELQALKIQYERKCRKINEIYSSRQRQTR